MRLLVTAATLAALAVTPSMAFAAKAKKHPAAAPAAMAMAHPGSIFLGNQIVGSDPDPLIRLEMQRDTGVFDGGGGGN